MRKVAISALVLAVIGCGDPPAPAAQVSDEEAIAINIAREYIVSGKGKEVPVNRAASHNTFRATPKAGGGWHVSIMTGRPPVDDSFVEIDENGNAISAGYTK